MKTMKHAAPKARIVYVHPDLPEGGMHATGWMGRSRSQGMWAWLTKHGVTIARTELR